MFSPSSKIVTCGGRPPARKARIKKGPAPQPADCQPRDEALSKCSVVPPGFRPVKVDWGGAQTPLTGANRPALLGIAAVPAGRSGANFLRCCIRGPFQPVKPLSGTVHTARTFSVAAFCVFRFVTKPMLPHFAAVFKRGSLSCGRAGEKKPFRRGLSLAAAPWGKGPETIPLSLKMAQSNRQNEKAGQKQRRQDKILKCYEIENFSDKFAQRS